MILILDAETRRRRENPLFENNTSAPVRLCVKPEEMGSYLL
jgi:hypothetical protein